MRSSKWLNIAWNWKVCLEDRFCWPNAEKLNLIKFYKSSGSLIICFKIEICHIDLRIWTQLDDIKTTYYRNLISFASSSYLNSKLLKLRISKLKSICEICSTSATLQVVSIWLAPFQRIFHHKFCRITALSIFMSNFKT